MLGVWGLRNPVHVGFDIKTWFVPRLGPGTFFLQWTTINGESGTTNQSAEGNYVHL